jgi:hypothetical protein
MEIDSSITNQDVAISASLSIFACEAERALSALFHSVKDSHGEKAALCVAEGWLQALETELAKCENGLPRLTEITGRSIAYFLAPRPA